MSAKERVRANIYKELLETEKKKNSRYSKVSLSLVFVGIIGLVGYQNLYLDTNEKRMVFNLTNNVAVNDKILIDEFFANEKFNKRKQEVKIETKNLFDLDLKS
jgi:uncharacterized membrane protein (DUF485 family)